MLLSPMFTAHYQGQLLWHGEALYYFVYGGFTRFARTFQDIPTVF